ncbi:MAG: hypothetical protein Q8Q49_00340 [bacterium]|nr:hypothetical protein [bacterium]
MDRHKTGLTFGAFAGLGHLVWVVLIAMNLAQGYFDWIVKLHSLNNPFVVMPFDLIRSALLIIVAAIAGYVAGFVFATIWNSVHK